MRREMRGTSQGLRGRSCDRVLVHVAKGHARRLVHLIETLALGP